MAWASASREDLGGQFPPVELLTRAQWRRAVGHLKLSRREAHIAALVLHGHAHKQIADALQMSPNTLREHQRRLHGKLQVRHQMAMLRVLLVAGRGPPGEDEEVSP